MSQRPGVRLPAGVAELLVDQPTGIGLIHLDPGRRLPDAVEDGLGLGRRPILGGRLGLSQVLLEVRPFAGQPGLGLLGQFQGGREIGVSLGRRRFGLLAAGGRLGRAQFQLLGLLDLGIRFPPEPIEFGRQGVGRGGRVRRRDERAEDVLRVAERAVEPDGQLPGHPELVEGLGTLVAVGVDGLVPGLPQAVEQVQDLPGNTVGVAEQL